MGRLREAGDASARALAAMRALGSKSGVAGCLNQQAMIQWAGGDVAAARQSFAQALPAYKALGSDGKNASLLAFSYVYIAAYRVAASRDALGAARRS